MRYTISVAAPSPGISQVVATSEDDLRITSTREPDPEWEDGDFKWMADKDGEWFVLNAIELTRRTLDENGEVCRCAYWANPDTMSPVLPGFRYMTRHALEGVRVTGSFISSRSSQRFVAGQQVDVGRLGLTGLRGYVRVLVAEYEPRRMAQHVEWEWQGTVDLMTLATTRGAPDENDLG